MFNHVGKILKFIAKVIVWLSVVAGVLLGLRIWFFATADALQSIRLITLLLAVFFGGFGGFVWGYFSAILLYAFGELVDTNQEISEKLDYYLSDPEESESADNWYETSRENEDME